MLKRALPTGVQTRIDQLITVGHEELARIIYDLTWTASDSPTAEVLSVRRDLREQQQQQHHAAPATLLEPASIPGLNGWISGGASSGQLEICSGQRKMLSGGRVLGNEDISYMSLLWLSSSRGQ